MALNKICPNCGNEYDELLHSKCPHCKNEERDELPAAKNDGTGIPRYLIKILCFVFSFAAWIPYLAFIRKQAKMAKECLAWGIIGGIVLIIVQGIIMGKFNYIGLIICIFYGIVWSNSKD